MFTLSRRRLGSSTRRVVVQAVRAAIPESSGPVSKAKTLYDGIATGRYQDGDTAYQTVANKDGPKHVIVQGMTGSGKTEGEKAVILACVARGANTIIVDVRKKTQSYGMLAPALNWLIVDDGLARSSFG